MFYSSSAFITEPSNQQHALILIETLFLADFLRSGCVENDRLLNILSLIGEVLTLFCCSGKC